MKQSNIRLVGVGAALAMTIAAGYGGYRAGLAQGAEQLPILGSGPAAGAGDKKVLYWHDPMVPGQKFDKAGPSPFMDMQLVPVYADDAADEGKVSISPRVQQNLGIRTSAVTQGQLSAPVKAVGSVAYNERDVALVQARSNGFVERLYARAPLDPVRKGQPLAELYVPDWVAAQEEYLSIKRMAGAGADLLDAARQRMRLAGMSDEQIRLVVSSGKVHSRLTVTAPISGVVAELHAREGMTVTPGTPLFRINGLGTVWINAQIPEQLAAMVRPGSAVTLRTPALAGMVFKGRVGAILPEVDAATRTVTARIEVANPGARLVPGMFASIALDAAAARDVLLVPSEAVIQTGARSVVMVAQAEGMFVPVDVEVGAEANGQSEIRRGLAAGQKVVVSGQFLVDSEASLKGTATRMSATPAPGSKGQGGDKPQAGPGPLHTGEGKVERIGKDDITLSHGPIATLQWGPMTMDFALPPTGVPPDIAAGDTVAFAFRQAADGTYQIATMSRQGKAAK